MKRLTVAVLILFAWSAPSLASGWVQNAIPLAALVAALAGDDAFLREQAAFSLGVRGEARAVGPHLVRLQAPQPAPGVRRAIYRSLCGIGDLRAIDALARLGAPEAASVLKALLAAADDPVIRVRLTVVLSRVRDGSAFAALVGLLADPLPAVRYFALGDLIRSGDAAAAGQISALYGSVAVTLAACDRWPSWMIPGRRSRTLAS